MQYLVTEIFIFILLASLVGMALGLMLSSMRLRWQREELDAKWGDRLRNQHEKNNVELQELADNHQKLIDEAAMLKAKEISMRSTLKTNAAALKRALKEKNAFKDQAENVESAYNALRHNAAQRIRALQSKVSDFEPMQQILDQNKSTIHDLNQRLSETIQIKDAEIAQIRRDLSADEYESHAGPAGEDAHDGASDPSQQAAIDELSAEIERLKSELKATGSDGALERLQQQVVQLETDRFRLQNAIAEQDLLIARLRKKASDYQSESGRSEAGDGMTASARRLVESLREGQSESEDS